MYLLFKLNPNKRNGNIISFIYKIFYRIDFINKAGKIQFHFKI